MWLHSLTRKGRPGRAAFLAGSVGLVAALTGSTALAGDLPGERKATQATQASATATGRPTVLRLGVPVRTTADATAYVLKAMIEKIFPYRVELVRATDRAIFEGMAAPDGGVDLHPEVWLPDSADLWKRYVEDGQAVRANRTAYVGFQGFCVPGYVIDRYGVKHVDDLRRPDVARLFAASGAERPEMWIGAPGWHQTAVGRVKARDYGFADRFDLRTGDEHAFLANLERAIAEKRPIVFGCYGPHSIVDMHDLAVLEEPPYAPDCYSVDGGPQDEAWFRRAVARCRGPIPKIHLAYSARLDEEAPDLARFLSGLALDHRMVVQWSAAIRAAGAPPEVTAKRLLDGQETPAPKSPQNKQN